MARRGESMQAIISWAQAWLQTSTPGSVIVLRSHRSALDSDAHGSCCFGCGGSFGGAGASTQRWRTARMSSRTFDRIGLSMHSIISCSQSCAHRQAESEPQASYDEPAPHC